MSRLYETAARHGLGNMYAEETWDIIEDDLRREADPEPLAVEKFSVSRIKDLRKTYEEHTFETLTKAYNIELPRDIPHEALASILYSYEYIVGWWEPSDLIRGTAAEGDDIDVFDTTVHIVLREDKAEELQGNWEHCLQEARQDHN